MTVFGVGNDCSANQVSCSVCIVERQTLFSNVRYCFPIDSRQQWVYRTMMIVCPLRRSIMVYWLMKHGMPVDAFNSSQLKSTG